MSYVAAPKRAKKWRIAALAISASGIAVVLFSFWQASPTNKALIEVPTTRDGRLVGRWRGGGRRSENRVRHCTAVFQPDGTGKTCLDENRGFWIPFHWGTENGVLYTRRMASDTHLIERHPYVFDDAKTVSFVSSRYLDLVAGEMARL